MAAYHEPFDGAPDDPDMVFNWEEWGWLLGPDDERLWVGRVEDGVYRLSNTEYRGEGEIYVQWFKTSDDDSNTSVQADCE